MSSVSCRNRSRIPSCCHPSKDEKEMEAFSSELTFDTRIFLVTLFTDRNAPCPVAAHQRRPKAGAEITPTVGIPSTSNAMSVAHTGTPRTKFFVPSIGSIIHCLPANSASPPNSSPTLVSLGYCCVISRRNSFSQATSASDTGVMSGFDETFRSVASKRSTVIASAVFARVSAKSISER